MADDTHDGSNVVTIDVSGAGPGTAPFGAVDDAGGAAAPETEAADPDAVVVVADEEAAGPQLPATAALQEDGSVILTLRRPVVMKWKASGTGAVTEDHRTSFHMHRLTGADMRALTNAGAGNSVVMGIARSCRIHIGVFNNLYDRMDGADALAASQVLSFFLDGGTPPSGPPPSR